MSIGHETEIPAEARNFKASEETIDIESLAAKDRVSQGEADFFERVEQMNFQEARAEWLRIALQKQAVLGHVEKYYQNPQYQRGADETTLENLREQVQIYSEFENIIFEKFGRSNIVQKGEYFVDEETAQVFVGSEEAEEAESKEKREAWLKAWIARVTTQFEYVVNHSSRTKEAENLEIVRSLVKERVPIVLEAEAQEYVETGDVQKVPRGLSLDFKRTGLFELILGRPKAIKELTLQMGDRKIVLANKADLQPSEKTKIS